MAFTFLPFPNTSDSKLTDLSVLLRKLLPFYGVRESIAMI